MYKEYFGLVDEPFRMTPDTRYLFKSHRHEEATSSLLYGIGEKKGFIVITGEIGTGKTTLCRSLLNQLDPATKTAVILNPSLSKSELLHAILDDLSVEMKMKNPTQKMLLDLLNAFLIEQAQAGGNVAVIIDEAQNLDIDVLESIRMLSNLETEREKLLQIILVGQPELNELLKLPKLEQLRQRIAVRYHITPLDKDEIPEYIAHRLMVAGNEKCVDFQRDAIEAIADYTRGTPRLINIICDKCLLAAYAMRVKVIDSELAATAIADHEGPQYERYDLRRRREAADQGIQGIKPDHPGDWDRAADHGAGHSGMPWQDDRPFYSGAQTVAASDWSGPPRQTHGPWPVAAAVAIIGLVLVIAIAAQAPVKRPPVVNTAVTSSTKIEAPATIPQKSAIGEILGRWKLDENSSGSSGGSAEASGMSVVRIVSDLTTIERINLPTLIHSGDHELALVGVTPAAYLFYSASLAGSANSASGALGRSETGRGAEANRFAVPRSNPDVQGVFDARILLPASLSYPENPLADPRLPQMLQAGLQNDAANSRNLTPLFNRHRYSNVNVLDIVRFREAILHFQMIAGLPADGVVGPLTWCALVSRANPDFPHLTS